MNARLALAVSALAALALWAACDPTAANGTALFIVAKFDGVSGVEQLRFSGVVGSTPAFMTANRPEKAMGTLSTPQSVRAILADSVGGSRVDVTVEALRADGRLVGRGTNNAISVVGHEVELEVTLTPTNGGGAGGGAGGGGGGGAGGGGGGGGGCNCPAGCCPPGRSDCARGFGTYFTCGTGATCQPPYGGSCGMGNTCQPQGDGCNVLQSDRCTPNGCMCGARGPCPDGTSCVTISVGGNIVQVCACNEFSNCGGCCDSDGGCRRLTDQTRDACGSAGFQCTRCPTALFPDGGNGAACTIGVCTGVGSTGITRCDAGCVSGVSCVDSGFPRCALGAACISCDVQRSDRCNGAACICGNSISGCPVNQVCVRPDGGPAAGYTGGVSPATCVPRFN